MFIDKLWSLSRDSQPKLLVGFMDGTVTVLGERGAQLAEKKLHAKYVVRVLWSPAGNSIVSVSWDGTVTVSGKDKAPLVDGFEVSTRSFD